MHPSRLERGAYQLAAALCAGTGLTMTALALMSYPASGLWLGAATHLAAAGWLAHQSLAAAMHRSDRVRIDADGQVWVRHAFAGADDSLSLPAHGTFVSPWVVMLRVGTAVLPVWRDAVGVDDFRRLCVAARWPAREPVASA